MKELYRERDTEIESEKMRQGRETEDIKGGGEKFGESREGVRKQQ